MRESNLVKSLRAVSHAHHYRNWVCSKLDPHLGYVVLDVGSGIGDYLDFYAKDLSRDVIASDTSDVMLDLLRSKKCEYSNVSVQKIDLGGNLQPILTCQRKVDTVTCINVLEHIKDDDRALKQALELVCEGGKLLLFVPAMSALYGSYDEMAGHYRRYDPQVLRRRLVGAGWIVECLEFFNFFGILSWFVAAKLLRLNNIGVDACKLLDKAVPVLRRLECRWPPIVGQSLFAVARKPSSL